MRVELVVAAPKDKQGGEGLSYASEAMADAFRGLGVLSADSDAYDACKWSALSDMVLYNEDIYDATIVSSDTVDLWVVSLIKGVSADSINTDW